MEHVFKRRALAALLVMAGACAPALAQKDARAAGDKPPIHVGAVSTLSSAPATFAETAKATQAFFDSINSTGGVQGRKLILHQEDDKGNPQAAREGAMRLINDVKVVANVGSASLLECAVNGPLYKDAGMVSIPGLGLDGGCFGSAAVAPVNTGPNAQLLVAMRYATERLWAERLCVMRIGNPVNLQRGFDAAIQGWSARTGRKLLLDLRDIQFQDNMEVHLKAAMDAKCQAMVFGGPGPFVIAAVKAARRVGTGSIPLLFLGSAYTDQVTEALGADGDGIYAMSEFEPWSSRSGSLSNWRTLMTRYHVPVTSSTQGGYVAGQVFVQVLRSIKGEITRDSVSAAFKTMAPMDVPMMGMPFVFGAGESHHPNQAAIPVRLEGGRWRIAHHDWIKAN